MRAAAARAPAFSRSSSGSNSVAAVASLPSSSASASATLPSSVSGAAPEAARANSMPTAMPSAKYGTAG
ncbi:hypothetical protein QP185_00425 [Sphingomonas aerolata]|uniref:hypothetical protein n=1 Tax=Sphingomonas aerolata TaxID=185951 RepID=UPI002FE08BD0